jgi:lysophospholipase L1-like esterase
VIPYKPRIVVLRAGGNDINAGKTPEQVLEAFKAFVTKVRAGLPETPIIFLSINPSPARWKKRDREQKASQLIEEFIAKDKTLAYVDISAPMLGPDGKPREELYAKDRLHNSPEGYKIWTSLVKPLLK